MIEVCSGSHVGKFKQFLLAECSRFLPCGRLSFVRALRCGRERYEYEVSQEEARTRHDPVMTGVAVSCVARRRGAGERTIELDQMTCDECASHFNRTTHGILQCAASEQSVLLPVLQVRLVGLQPTHRRFAVLQHNFFRIAAEPRGWTAHMFTPVSSPQRIMLLEKMGAARSEAFVGFGTPLLGGVAQFLMNDKSTFQERLSAAGVPVPRRAILEVARRPRLHQQLTAAGMRFPLVLKPLRGTFGRGVVTNISDLHSLDQTLQQALRAQKSRIGFRDNGYYVDVTPGYYVEEMTRGENYRVLILDGKVVDVTRRGIPRVVGDGQSTVHSLVAQASASRMSLGAAPFDQSRISKDLLRQVPAKGEHKLLDTIVTGQAINSLHYVGDWHPSLHELARRVQSVIPGNHRLTGMDYITTDITRNYKRHGVIIEANPTPDLAANFLAWGRPHCPLDLARTLLDAMDVRS